MAIRSSDTRSKRWPGGVVVVPAYAWKNQSRGLTDQANTNSSGYQKGYAKRELRDTQNAASAAAAAVTVSFTPEDVGLIPGRYYTLAVGVRWDAGANGAYVNLATTSGTPLSGSGYSGASVSTPPGSGDFGGYGDEAVQYGPHKFGLRIFTGPTGGYMLRKYTAGEDIEIKVYRSSGSAAIWIDQLYFLPYSDPGLPDATLIRASEYDLSQFETFRAGADFGTADDGAPHVSAFCFDRQQVSGLFDPTFEWTAWGELGADAFYDFVHSSGGRDDLNWITHAYTFARLELDNESNHQSTTGSNAHLTMGSATQPLSTAMLDLPSWGVVYLGPTWGIAGDNSFMYAAWRHDGTYFDFDDSHLDGVGLSTNVWFLRDCGSDWRPMGRNGSSETID